MSYHPSIHDHQQLSGKVVLIQRNGRTDWGSVAAGLGATYDIPTNVPLFPTLRLDLPMDTIMHDAMSSAGRDLWSRTKKNWAWVAAGGMVIAAAVLMRKRA